MLFGCGYGSVFGGRFGRSMALQCKVLHKDSSIVFRKQAAILSIFRVRRRAVVFLKAGDNARRTQKTE